MATAGSNFERPAFQAMLEDIRHGIVDCVVVKDLITIWKGIY